MSSPATPSNRVRSRSFRRDPTGRDIDNPAASFGEIRLDEQYCVGPGSQIVCGCPTCSDKNAPDHVGRYELANERPPVVWSEAEFRAFIEADPAITPGEADDTRGPARHGDGSESDSGLDPDASFAEAALLSAEY